MSLENWVRCQMHSGIRYDIMGQPVPKLGQAVCGCCLGVMLQGGFKSGEEVHAGNRFWSGLDYGVMRIQKLTILEERTR